MSKFTPGPWEVKFQEGGPEEFRGLFVNGSKGSGHVCYIVPNSEELEKGNAELISACPDMYEAIKDLICAVNMARQEQHIRSFGEDLRTCAYDESADSLAKKIAGIIENAQKTLAKADGK